MLWGERGRNVKYWDGGGHLGREYGVHEGDVLRRHIRGGLDDQDAGLALPLPGPPCPPGLDALQVAEHPGERACERGALPLHICTPEHSSATTQSAFFEACFCLSGEGEGGVFMSLGDPIG